MSRLSIAICSMTVLAFAFAQTAIAEDMAMAKAGAKAGATSAADKKLIESAMQAAPK
jgi:hypothetical protein